MLKKSRAGQLAEAFILAAVTPTVLPFPSCATTLDFLLSNNIATQPSLTFKTIKGTLITNQGVFVVKMMAKGIIIAEISWPL